MRATLSDAGLRTPASWSALVLVPLDRVPEALWRALDRADRRAEGFLMRDSVTIAGDRATEFEVGKEPSLDGVDE